MLIDASSYKNLVIIGLIDLISKIQKNKEISHTLTFNPTSSKGKISFVS